MSVSGDRAIIDSGSGSNLTVQLNGAAVDSKYIEVLGKINDDYSLNAHCVTSFGNNFGRL